MLALAFPPSTTKPLPGRAACARIMSVAASNAGRLRTSIPVAAGGRECRLKLENEWLRSWKWAPYRVSSPAGHAGLICPPIAFHAEWPPVMNCTAPPDRRALVILEGNLPAMINAQARGALLHFLQKSAQSCERRIESTTSSSGSTSFAIDFASLRLRATWTACCGANFRRAEVIAAARASYSSMRRMLPCDVVPEGD